MYDDRQREPWQQPLDRWVLTPASRDGPPASASSLPALRHQHDASFGCAIRSPLVGEWLACWSCGVDFLAAGPTGYIDDRAVCDLCLLQRHQPLGMVLALVAVSRAFANADPGEHAVALTELGAFARIYERLARRFGPPRRFELTDPPRSGP